MNVEYGYAEMSCLMDTLIIPMLTWTMLCVLCVTSDARLSRLYLDPVSQEDIKLSSWKCVVAEMAAPSWKFIAPKVLTHAHVHAH